MKWVKVLFLPSSGRQAAMVALVGTALFIGAVHALASREAPIGPGSLACSAERPVYVTAYCRARPGLARAQ